jgi:hypothetical protein
MAVVYLKHSQVSQKILIAPVEVLQGCIRDTVTPADIQLLQVRTMLCDSSYGGIG